MSGILYGLENPELEKVLKGARVGIVTNPTGVDQHFRSTAEYVHKFGTPAAFYGPEHGVRGDQQASAVIEGGEMDPVWNVPAFSLFGKTQHMTPEMLDGVDTVVYDIQDIGVRFYTYLKTLEYVMEDCAKVGCRVVVLDRPNPLGGEKMEGICLEPDCESFVGAREFPARYGMTVGEYARFLQKRRNIPCDLQIVPCLGWRRNMTFEEWGGPWVMPSPNIPTVVSALVYLGTCIFEGTNLSEGRGTTHPFEIIGAPFVDAEKWAAALEAYQLPGVRWRPMHFIPQFSKHVGTVCHGLQVHVTDFAAFRSFETGLRMFQTAKELFGDAFEWKENFDRLLGSKKLRAGQETFDEVIQRAQKESAAFAEVSKEFFLY